MMDVKLLPRFNLFLKNLGLITHTKFFTDIKRMKTEQTIKEEVGKEDFMAYKEPFGQFKNWFDEACNTPSIIEPRAMCLATCTRSGIPSARFVILRGYDTDGFKFFTNYCSRKGKELNENPNAALAFYWESLRRSIRIEGIVKKLSDEESTQFFHSRPKSYQIEAAFSDQSQPISSRNSLKEKEKKFKSQFENCDVIPKPKEWGGFILKPHTVEFRQDHNDHSHDRIRFRLPKKDEVINKISLHERENGWVYEKFVL